MVSHAELVLMLVMSDTSSLQSASSDLEGCEREHEHEEASDPFQLPNQYQPVLFRALRVMI